MRNSYYFLLLSLILIVISIFSRVFLDYDQLLFDSLSQKLTTDQIQDVIFLHKKWTWLGYVLIPLLLLVKTSLISAIIDAGCYCFDKAIKYKTIYSIVIKAEFIFLSVPLSKIIWFLVFQTSYTLEDIQNFYPFSVINYMGYEGLDPWWVYPFQALNLFEILYWLFLAYFLSKELKISTESGLSIIASSYGISLLIWIVSVMFFTLNMS